MGTGFRRETGARSTVLRHTHGDTNLEPLCELKRDEVPHVKGLAGWSPAGVKVQRAAAFDTVEDLFPGRGEVDAASEGERER